MVARQTGLDERFVLHTLCTATLNPNKVVNKLIKAVISQDLYNPSLVSFLTVTHSQYLAFTKPLHYMVKPHGQLVSVSSMPRSTYTPDLSTL